MLLFICLPYSHNPWLETTDELAYLFEAAFVPLAILIITISKCLMYAARHKEVTYLQYILWNMGEVLLISLLYASFCLHCYDLGIIDMNGTTFPECLLSSMTYFTFSLIIPYLIAGMYFTIIEKNNIIYLMNIRNTAISGTPCHKEEKIAFYDKNGILKLAVSLSHLYYIESNDNYVIVWYADDKKVLQKHMIRCRLKQIEATCNYDNLIRCNRKYIVNMDNVHALRKGDDKYELDLNHEKIPPLAVTKSYSGKVISSFTRKQFLDRKDRFPLPYNSQIP